jgi:hypothetical protein
VDWRYLIDVMDKMNFPSKWRTWMLECISSVSMSVLANDNPTYEFKMERGLRQGDPLSPFLFLLAAEGLNFMMKVLVEKGLFQGYEMGPKGNSSITHLQFFDDTLLMGAKSWGNIRAQKSVLILFEVISGLKANFHKSRLFGVNTSDSWLHEAALVMNCKHGRLPFLYLGLPIGGDPRKLNFWYPLIDRVRKWLSGWKSNNLSIGGRLILHKYVIYALPVYFLSFFKAPLGIISYLDFIFNAFVGLGG